MKKVSESSYKCLWSFKCDGPVIDVAITENCSLIAVGSVDCNLYLLNKNGELLWKKSLDNEVWGVAISKDSSHIAAGTACKKPANGTVYVYDREGKELLQHNIGAPVWGVSLSMDGTILGASSWNNKVYSFIEDNRVFYLKSEVSIGRYGQYGISLSDDGNSCLVASYDDGIALLNKSWAMSRKFLANTGLYRVKLSGDGSVGIIGCRDGNALLINDLHKEGQINLLPKISQRPICGVSFSNDYNILVLGSFDGRTYVTSGKGNLLWLFETDGEIWSTAVSTDGSLICIGSGDGNVYLLYNFCSSAALKEIETLETGLKKTEGELEKRLDDIISAYLEYGLINYGVTQLKKLMMIFPNKKDLILGKIIEFMLLDIDKNPNHDETHYLLASLLGEKGDLVLAAHHYQKAVIHPNFRLSSLISLGDIFAKLGLKLASLSCFYRANKEELNRDDMRVIFNLARSYEDIGELDEARKLYELLLSRNMLYSNTYYRLQNILKLKEKKEEVKPHIDYTGLTVSLLGPDIPQINETDKSLHLILKMRAKEFFEKTEEREIMKKAIYKFLKTKHLSPPLKFNDLSYEMRSYLKYEYLLPEDEIKKQLEMIMFLRFLLSNQWIGSSLDIGTATGRYPFFLATEGISTIGIDIERESIIYAKSKQKIKEYPQFCVEDASYLSFCQESFDLVTCMMGTFAHFTNKQKVCQEVYRVLKGEGLFIISSWDTQCEYLSFLSMYPQSQRKMLRKNSLTQSDTSRLLKQIGFSILDIKNFVFLSNLSLSELGYTPTTDIMRIVEFELAMRGLFSYRHGQMYMIVAKKKSFSH